MSTNQFGKYFVLMSFGESHGPAIGGVIDGCPSGVEISTDYIQAQLDRRKPGQSQIVSARQEADKIELLSGVFENKTLGTPIAFLIRNSDQRSQDYDQIKSTSRTGHADDLWQKKFVHWDHRGGGRSSGRETAVRVAAGSIAYQVLKKVWPTYVVKAMASEIGGINLDPAQRQLAIDGKLNVDDFSSRMPGVQNAQVEELLLKAKANGDSYGGAVELIIAGVPAGLGEPVFHKLKSQLAAAMMTIGATIGVEFGFGARFSQQSGLQTHGSGNAEIYGGIRGGISTGEPISLKVFFKPTSSIMDVAKKGRHDPCIVPRAVPVVEAMAHLVFADMMLAQRLNNL